ncbi:MAG: class I SAM-dependent methyltransferase [Bacteroidetes bacterium]|nr:class I SAM-dependent methyltransferase [Bacteroidota bacterium]
MGILDLKHDVTFELDDPRRTLQHRDIILSKPFLKKLYQEWYGVFKIHATQLPPGILLELGSGAGFLKEILPEVVTSDVLDIPEMVDRIFYAQQMPFEKESMAGIFMTDVFHHIPDSAAFLREADRVLVSGGRIVMSEPANTIWGKFIYKTFHHEPFDTHGDWFIPPSGPMSGSNQALPYIVFIRDRPTFEMKFPNLKIKDLNYHTPLRYLLSGGVSKKQLVPDFSFGFFKRLDSLLLRISEQFAMFVTIVIEKE